MSNYNAGDDREYESLQLDIAVRLLPQGFRPLPALLSLNGDDKLDKLPLCEWGKLKTAAPTREQVLRMRWSDANAVQTILPDGVAAIDMETPEATNLIWQALADRGISTELHNTHRGGHAYLRDGNGLHQTLVIRAGGRQIGDIIAGRDHLITWQSLWHTPAADHVAYAHKIAGVPDVVALVREALEPHYPDLVIERANGPRAAAAPASGLLSACLERLEGVSGPNSEGFYRACCPFHENGRDDLTLNQNWFGCWSTNCGRRGPLTELAAHLDLEGADEYESPVPEPTPWPEPLAPEAFHGLAGWVVAAIDPYTEAPQSYLLSSFLAAFGTAAGAGLYGMAEGVTRHPPRLFTATVGATAISRKGTALDHIRALLGRAIPLAAETDPPPELTEMNMEELP